MKLLPALLIAFSTTIVAQPLPSNLENTESSQLYQESNTMVTMRDGTALAVRVYTPDINGTSPTLYAAGPYPSADAEANFPINWLLNQGFNLVVANVRGTGKSEGSFEFLGRNEQQDHYELVEWIASQQWSDGQVAGFGAGYYGTSQWFMAIQNPPHLSCIAPINATLEPYKHWAWQGGLASDEFITWYEREIREPHAVLPANEARFVELDLRLQQLMHNTADDWWSERTAANQLNQIRIPALQLGSWQEGTGSWLGALTLLSAMPSTTHTYVSAEANLLGSSEFLNTELLPYYQWCFNGKPRSGPAIQPTLRYQQQDKDQLRASSSWPPANIKYTELFMQASTDSSIELGTLALDQSAPSSNRSTVGQSAKTSLVFRSEALAQDIDLAGPLLLELHISSSAEDTAFKVELFEERTQIQFQESPPLVPNFLNPEINTSLELLTASREELISTGILKASMRETQKSTQSDSKQVIYTLQNPDPLYPGRVYKLDIALNPSAKHVSAGNRLLIKVSHTNDAALRNLERIDTIYHSSQYPSKLWLPLSADSQLAFVTPTNNESNLGFGDYSDSIFILDSFIDTESTAQEDENNLGENNEDAQLADELFNSDSPVILIP